MSVPSRTLEHMFDNIAAEGPAGFLAAAVELDCARVGLVQEAESRGVVSESSSASSTDWLLANSFHLEPADAARTVDLARLCALPKNQVMAAAVSGGTLPVRQA